MASETYESVVLPILERVAVLGQEDPHAVVSADALAADLALDPALVRAELPRLVREGGLVRGKLHGDYDGGLDVSEVGLTERGARAVKRWPSDDPHELLLDLIDRRIAASTGAERSRWQAVRDKLGEIGTASTAGLVVELVKLGGSALG